MFIPCFEDVIKSISIVFIVAIVGLLVTAASVVKVQLLMAIDSRTCMQCTTDFVPGQEKKDRTP